MTTTQEARGAPEAAQEAATLPGTPPQKLQAAWRALSPERQAALLPHLLGGTPATRIETWLERAGHRVSATRLKDYRRSLRQDGAIDR
ncbi:hypothetical protein [Kineococcus esterisolvens]|uniref:hypothetical protein n=1 Tax=unclassified Kineococcus TaxID=2621656 RepID=UPI003D7E1E05